MNFRKIVLCVLWILSLMNMPMAVSWSLSGQDNTEYKDDTSQQSILSQEDLEIIQNLNFWENLPLLNEEDFGLFEESHFGVGQQ